jgi:hypothetical protein
LLAVGCWEWKGEKASRDREDKRESEIIPWRPQLSFLKLILYRGL